MEEVAADSQLLIATFKTRVMGGRRNHSVERDQSLKTGESLGYPMVHKMRKCVWERTQGPWPASGRRRARGWPRALASALAGGKEVG